jgi:hypothetical protein
MGRGGQWSAAGWVGSPKWAGRDPITEVMRHGLSHHENAHAHQKSFAVPYIAPMTGHSTRRASPTIRPPAASMESPDSPRRDEAIAPPRGGRGRGHRPQR